MAEKIFFLFIFIVLLNFSSQTAQASETNRPEKPDSPKAWTFMFYFAATSDLVEFTNYTINEMEKTGSGDNIAIAVQYDGPEQGDSVRYIVQKDNDTSNITSPKEELGEINTGDLASLTSFVDWTLDNAPAEHYCFVFNGHGSGSIDMMKSIKNCRLDSKNMCYDPESNYSSSIDAAEMNQFAKYLSKNSGRGKVSLIVLNACLMGNVEAINQFSRNVEYIVASEAVVRGGLSFLLAQQFPDINKNPQITGAEIGKRIVDGYFELVTSQSMTNDSLNGVTSYAPGFIVSLIDCSRFYLGGESSLVGSLNVLSHALRVDLKTDLAAISKAMKEAQNYTSYAQPMYADIDDLCGLFYNNAASSNIRTAAWNVRTALERTVVYFKTSQDAGKEANVGHGLSIFTKCDKSSLLKDYLNTDFAAETEWDEFLKDFLTASNCQQQ
ncbi:MAG: clostripain-related cysteine peptidase [Candidatus Wallbacteria bacterium]|nr:clostripain-related cysteine peptidase [Candidatus Wallbacteria bacterium]